LAQEINDKVVVITGASSGLGEATARRLAREGAKLVLGARRLERLQTLAGELSLGDEAVMQTDVTDYEQVRHLVDHAVQTHGRVDAIINNAGLMPLSPLEALKVEDWDRTIDVNLKGVLYGIAAVLPHMKEQQGGHVINVSSVAGHTVNPGGAVYSATKYGVTRHLGGAAAGGQALQHPDHRHLARGGRHRAARQRYGTRCRRERKCSLRERRSFRRLLRQYGALRHEPAGRRGRQRDLVPTDEAGTLSRRVCERTGEWPLAS